MVVPWWRLGRWIEEFSWLVWGCRRIGGVGRKRWGRIDGPFSLTWFTFSVEENEENGEQEADNEVEEEGGEEEEEEEEGDGE